MERVYPSYTSRQLKNHTPHIENRQGHKCTEGNNRCSNVHINIYIDSNTKKLSIHTKNEDSRTNMCAQHKVAEIPDLSTKDALESTHKEGQQNAMHSTLPSISDSEHTNRDGDKGCFREHIECRYTQHKPVETLDLPTKDAPESLPKEGQRDAMHRTLPSSSDNKHTDEGSDRCCFQASQDSKNTEVRYIGNQHHWSQAPTRLRERVRTLLSTTNLEAPRINRIAKCHFTEEYRSNTEEYHGYQETYC